MSKSIHQLVPDIEQLVKTRGWFDAKLQSEFAGEVASRLQAQYNGDPRKPTLRLSQMGPRCPKALWHSIHTPGEAEPLPAWAEVKYSFGHIIEGLAIALAKASGHEVTGEQDELVLDDIVGHRDAVIDGCLVDVKSTSSRGFQKFKSGEIIQEDSFGYLDQLDGYLVSSLQDPLVREKKKGYILAIDKQLGHICLYEHFCREHSIRQRIAKYKSVVERSDPPPCECGVVEHGKSGNLQLDTRASYSPYKYCCFPELRTFIYSSGPVYLTYVARKPEVLEVDKHGRHVYH